MSNLYYIETRPKSVQKVIETLKSFGLHTDTVETHYIYYQRSMHGELIMWSDGDKYPSFVFRSQEELVRKCGIKIDY